MAKAKDIEGLDCGAGAGEGIRLVLDARLGEMLEQRDAALGAGGLDGVEGVHDMRVASRRLRSALRDFAPYMNVKKLGDAADALKKLADALGRVRDNDVAIIGLEKIAAEAPDEVRAGVEEFARGRRVRRDESRAELERFLDAGRMEEMRDGVTSALGRALKGERRGKKGRGDGRAGGLSFDEAGREIVAGRWEELRERCASIHRPFKVKCLHESRIAAKRLRYALELFAQCRGPQLRDIAGEVARMQKSLGELHDCDEWIAVFGDWLSERGGARRGARAQHAVVEQESAAVWLLGHFVRERTKNYHDALARWHVWEANDFESHLRTALSAAAIPEGPAPSAGLASEALDDSGLSVESPS